jgi:hypothetical protein
MKQLNRSYTPEFRAAAVQQVTHGRRSVPTVARSRAPSTRAVEQVQIVTEIRRAQTRHRGRYGRRRMTTEVGAALGRPVNEKRIGRLMRAHDLGSRKRRWFRVVTTDSKHVHPLAPNVLERDFTAAAPNQK